MVFYKRHVCRADPWPDWLVECFAILEANPEVYHSMNGPERVPRDRDDPRLGHHAAARAGSRCRRCVFSGRYDEVTPAMHRGRAPGDPGLGVRRACEESSHMAQAEQPEETLALVRGFLSRVEGAAAA